MAKIIPITLRSPRGVIRTLSNHPMECEQVSTFLLEISPWDAICNITGGRARVIKKAQLI